MLLQRINRAFPDDQRCGPFFLVSGGVSPGALSLLPLSMMPMPSIIQGSNAQDKTTKEAKSYLPIGWKALDLTKDQKAKVQTIHLSYKTKILDLEDQIKTLKASERKDMVAVLTPAQKTKLTSLVTGEEPEKAPTKTKD